MQGILPVKANGEPFIERKITDTSGGAESPHPRIQAADRNHSGLPEQVFSVQHPGPATRALAQTTENQGGENK